MAPLIFVGVWTCVTTLAATYGGFFYRTHPALPADLTHATRAQSRDLRTITVPVIRNGQILGYISADFSIIGANTDQHQNTPDIEGYVLDEAYRLIYAETGVDFDFIQKTDLNRLTADIKSHVNTRLEREAIQDVLVRSFHYVPRDQIQK